MIPAFSCRAYHHAKPIVLFEIWINRKHQGDKTKVEILFEGSLL